MDEALKIRLGEYLLSVGVRFEEVDTFDLDPDTRTLDIGYRKDNVWHYREMSGQEILEFATFLVTGGE